MPDSMNEAEVPIKDYVDALVVSLRLEIAQLEEASQKAVQLATASLNHRLESMNEFRTQITNERADYVRTDTFRWAIGALLGIVGIVTAILGLWHPGPIDHYRWIGYLFGH